MGRRADRGGHHLDALDPVPRAVVAATLVAFALLPLATAWRALAQGWQPTGDVAIIGIRSLDAWTSQAPLEGQPTTGAESSGIDSSHPGPLENWLVGPLMRATTPRVGLAVGVALINGAALAGACWLAYRRGGPALLAMVAVGLALLVGALGPGSLFDPYNSELPTYPTITAALAAWSVALGDRRTLPVLVVAASVAAQAHVAGAVTVGPMVLVALVALGRDLARDRTIWRDERAWLLGSAAAAALCWAPVLVGELRDGSNLWALVRTAGADGSSLGLAYTLERVVTAIAPVPLFARSTGAYGFLEDRGPLAVLAAAAIVGGAGSIAVHLRLRRGRRGPATLAVVVGLALVASILVWAGSPPVAAYRVDSIRWLWSVGLLVWLSLAWSLWSLAPAAWRRPAQRAAVGVAAVAVALVAVTTVVGTARADLRDDRFMDPTDELAADVLAGLPPGRYQLRFEGSESLVTVGPGVALRLVDAGREVAVDPGPFGRGYGPARTDGGDVDATVAIVDGTPDLGPDQVLLGSVTFEGSDGEPRTISAVREP